MSEVMEDGRVWDEHLEQFIARAAVAVYDPLLNTIAAQGTSPQHARRAHECERRAVFTELMRRVDAFLEEVHEARARACETLGSLEGSLDMLQLCGANLSQRLKEMMFSFHDLEQSTRWGSLSCDALQLTLAHQLAHHHTPNTSPSEPPRPLHVQDFDSWGELGSEHFLSELEWLDAPDEFEELATVSHSGEVGHQQRVHRFLNTRMTEWGLDACYFEGLEDILWDSGNPGKTWRALEEGLERGCSPQDLVWGYSVRAACEEAHDVVPDWCLLWGALFTLEVHLGVDEMVTFVGQCLEVFEQDYASKRQWYAMDKVELSERNSYFSYFLAAIIAQVPADMSPLFYMESLGCLDIGVHSSFAEYEARRPDAPFLDPGASSFHPILRSVRL